MSKRLKADTHCPNIYIRGNIYVPYIVIGHITLNVKISEATAHCKTW